MNRIPFNPHTKFPSEYSQESLCALNTFHAHNISHFPTFFKLHYTNHLVSISKHNPCYAFERRTEQNMYRIKIFETCPIVVHFGIPFSNKSVLIWSIKLDLFVAKTNK
jgi:hypothetical protein